MKTILKLGLQVAYKWKTQLHGAKVNNKLTYVQTKLHEYSDNDMNTRGGEECTKSQYNFKDAG